MYIGFENLEDVLIVSFMGELDHHSAEEVRVKVDDRIDRDNIKKLVIDFSGVTFMDSSGIGVIIGRYKKMALRKGNISIAAINKNIKRVFELSGIFKIIKVYENIKEAVQFS
ncbi:anti-sigma F factor antagonist [Clostridium tarantellae]|uniref:Anti-sigma F factor antagonist n=1 Tax=Clostridium tarantellae TaxID=39493 RepID=A0A6I1MJD8_9CLOT|nr:anti-sigma F factor antagonist [Clostridium tarantellae]MPQ42267.1 anti-sigma F factor antagonist [Clostridium tarantellae]